MPTKLPKALRRKPESTRRPTQHPMYLPQEPGKYFWSEWGRIFDVYRRGRTLYVNPGVEVKITPFIAGQFRRVR